MKICFWTFGSLTLSLAHELIHRGRARLCLPSVISVAVDAETHRDAAGRCDLQRLEVRPGYSPVGELDILICELIELT